MDQCGSRWIRLDQDGCSNWIKLVQIDPNCLTGFSDMDTGMWLVSLFFKLKSWKFQHMLDFQLCNLKNVERSHIPASKSENPVPLYIKSDQLGSNWFKLHQRFDWFKLVLVQTCSNWIKLVQTGLRWLKNSPRTFISLFSFLFFFQFLSFLYTFWIHFEY